ncbi:AraC family transcriptional regulator [Tepidibacter hydrothermalis]|uniref:AraC family transcriptional regulator n=1 Tax=Tepidibacter hydrothermalis TaxID=3036126 RepID=A0ABY8EDA1_9FIRM|nr:AraC family transcriptional regulator [Tepidibacter hydrothermalis]WFD10912.1 AraC family transcriptional regulator [Tepidibacter hydrothermalis]
MEYLNTFERAIIYIENHLGEDINVSDVAKEAGYSYYHLTRIFQSLLGENIGNYIQKRRLSNGAKQLLYSDKKIISIALENGFDSPEAFSRAFKAVYRVSPKEYRNNRLEVFIGNKKEISMDLLKHITTSITVQPEIKYIDDIYVAGIHGVSSINDIYSLWQRFEDVVDIIPNKHHSKRTFGICEQLQETHTLNYDMDFSEVIGMEVTCYDNLPDGIVAKTIPAGKYAVFTHRGLLSEILKTYEYIWGTWVLITKEVLDERADFELYDKRFLGRDNEQSEMDIYIPIK